MYGLSSSNDETIADRGRSRNQLGCDVPSDNPNSSHISRGWRHKLFLTAVYDPCQFPAARSAWTLQATTASRSNIQNRSFLYGNDARTNLPRMPAKRAKCLDS